MSAIFKEASGSLRGTLLRAAGFFGLDMIEETEDVLWNEFLGIIKTNHSERCSGHIGRWKREW